LSKAVKTLWLQGIPEDKVEDFKKMLVGNTVQNQQFLKILRAKYETIERKGLSEEDYRTTDWTHLQAFNNGRLSILREIADLFNFEGV
jgi:hypothetical protein